MMDETANAADDKYCRRTIGSTEKLLVADIVKVPSHESPQERGLASGSHYNSVRDAALRLLRCIPYRRFFAPTSGGSLATLSEASTIPARRHSTE
jgi:hypothetical protein